MKRIALSFVAGAGAVALAIGRGAPAADDRPTAVIERGSVRAIKLPEAVAKLPDAPGRETVMTLCGTCHTPEYITLQPPFSRQTWINEVTKMRTTFNGPIPEEKVDEIVNYLMAVRGEAKK